MGALAVRVVEAAWNPLYELAFMVASVVLVDSVPVTFRLDIFAYVDVRVYKVEELARMSVAIAEAHVRAEEVVMGPWLDQVPVAPPRP